MEHSNSRTFKGLKFFFQNSRTSQGHYQPWIQHSWISLDILDEIVSIC